MIRRLSREELFHLRGPHGMEEISDETLELRITESERTEMRRAYPESTLSQTEPIEAV